MKEVPKPFEIMATVQTEHTSRVLPRTGRVAPASLLSAEGPPYSRKGRTQPRQCNPNKSFSLVKLPKLLTPSFEYTVQMAHCQNPRLTPLAEAVIAREY